MKYFVPICVPFGENIAAILEQEIILENYGIATNIVFGELRCIVLLCGDLLTRRHIDLAEAGPEHELAKGIAAVAKKVWSGRIADKCYEYVQSLTSLAR